MIDHKYAYFIGGLILLTVYLLFYFLRKDLRTEMIFGSLLGLPFGFTEFLYVPEYWSPGSLFNLIDRLGFGIESFMFAFFASGIATVGFEVLENKKLKRNRKKQRYVFTHYFPYFLIIGVFVGLDFMYPSKTIYSLIATGLVGATYMGIRRSDLLTQIFTSGLIFMVLYFFLYLIFDMIFPTFVEDVYSLENFLGIYFMGFPIEEALFAFSCGASWSVLYEYIKGMRTT